MRPSRRMLLRGGIALGLTGLVGGTQLHRILGPRAGDPQRAALGAVHSALTGVHRAGLRKVNPEWDLIERMMVALTLACVALEGGELTDRADVALGVLWQQLQADLAHHGARHFLLGYGQNGGWKGNGRSLFVEGEAAIIMGAARMVRDSPAAQQAFAERIAQIRYSMGSGPIGSGESYPDECWTFCNTAALVALRMSEVLDGADHSDAVANWLWGARTQLIDPATGLLNSAYTYEGQPSEPPEGSSLWWSAHALRLVDGGMASRQYEASREELAGSVLGFAYAREWPESAEARSDIDSGTVVPILEAGPASSGWALVAARSFDDVDFEGHLRASVELTAWPRRESERLSLGAGNPVGDAILAYSLVQGPLWSALGA